MHALGLDCLEESGVVVGEGGSVGWRLGSPNSFFEAVQPGSAGLPDMHTATATAKGRVGK